jgi:uncharacterized tellurite resistance protein B-like protein
MDQVTPEERRTFIALLCRVAWADGIVTIEERQTVAAVAQKMGFVEANAIDKWLDHGVPDQEIRALPRSLGQYFYYEAFRLAEADGDLAQAEVDMLKLIVSRVFAGHDTGTPLGRVVLTKRGIE